MKLALVGASGAVGQELMHLLEERNVSCDEFVLFGPERSAGKSHKFRNRNLVVKLLQHNNDFKDSDYAFVSAGASTSKEYADSWEMLKISQQID